MKDNIVRYSKIRKKNMNYIEKRNYKKSNNTILLDTVTYNFHGRDFNYEDIKTLIIHDEDIKNSSIEIHNTYANNIYINNQKNLGELTIPYNFILENKISIKFSWGNFYSIFNKINIILNDKEISLDSKFIKKITIAKSEDNKLSIKINNYNSVINYLIDSFGKIEEEKISYKITNEDIIEGTLDLRKYDEYKNIDTNGLTSNKVIMTKDILKKINKYNNGSWGRILCSNLQIIDDEKMKLIHKTIEVSIPENERAKIKKKDKNYFIFISGNDPKLIYIDKNDNLKLIERSSLEKEKNVEKVKFDLEESFFSSSSDCNIVIKYKNGSYKIINFDDEYEIKNLYKKFILLNITQYINISNNKSLYNSVLNDDWIYFITNIHIHDFKKIYEDYLNFKDHISKLLNLGLSYKALIYLYDKKINSILNPDEENIKLEKYEISHYNEIGKEYIKTKRLNK